MRILIAFLLLSACGRGITNSERTLMGELMGDSFNSNEIKMLESGFIGMRTRTYPARPQVTCREKIAPPPSGPTIRTRTAGVVAWQHVLTNPDWTLTNYAEGYPERINLVAAMYFAHEMTHVWQWQNRATTGYSPFRGLAEHKPGVDPYLFDPTEEIRFLDMGYEQQASLVEEYICCRTLAPEAARTQRLYDTLSAVMPVQHPTQTPRPAEVLGVHEDADLLGICD
ncbi:hypothetical protein [Octadecabacter ascidiaceicola]|uniref:Plant Basic Secretory Protein n=1 Tax=Octadecabacter ascidiaceicola TaxID=1655543 RepID=A0A238JQR3_9RHOB|nr:hypothetical protein [Octadecabacter ascidiaceicola]SMX33028.1 hypothetical protein OCA8868_00868 [Octadecabacter ascidiaceicola]